MTAADFRRVALELLAGALPKATTRELADAAGGIDAGLGVHTAHNVLRTLEGEGKVAGIGMARRGVVWVLKRTPTGGGGA